MTSEALIESLYEAIAPLRQHYEEDTDTEATEDSVVDTLEKILDDAFAEGQHDQEAVHRNNIPYEIEMRDDFIESQHLTADFIQWLHRQPVRS